MRFAVESWSNDFGSPIDMDPNADDSSPQVQINVEKELDDWGPITPHCEPASTTIFIDGVQQRDAIIWVPDGDDVSQFGACVSFAAGWVRCDGAARVEQSIVRRAVFATQGFGSIDCGSGVCYTSVPAIDTSPQGIDTYVQRFRDELEVEVAQEASGADFIVIDGHLSRREGIAGAVGYIKSHHTQYLPPEQAAIVGKLAPCQRTPVFLLEGPRSGYSRYSWYLKLPGGQGHPWAGVVRCEASSSLSPNSALIEFVDLVSASLPRFASAQYKDSRAPQNLYPVAGLERELRRRMGEREVLLRMLQRVSRNS